MSILPFFFSNNAYYCTHLLFCSFQIAPRVLSWFGLQKDNEIDIIMNSSCYTLLAQRKKQCCYFVKHETVIVIMMMMMLRSGSILSAVHNDIKTAGTLQSCHYLAIS